MSDAEPLYSQRPEWSDVIPLEQYENANPLAPILYSEACQYNDLSKTEY